MFISYLRNLDKLTTLDNTRLLAAQRAGIDVKVRIHEYYDQIPPEMARRFNYDGNMPKNWGEAVEFRILNQNSNFRNNAVYGTQIEPKAN